MKCMKGKTLSLSLALALAVFFVIVTPLKGITENSQQINSYIQTIQEGSLTQKIIAAKEITQSGTTNRRLFDIVEKELLAAAQGASGSEEIDYLSWLCKVLASSGLPKYKKTVEEIANTTKSLKLQLYAKQSLGLFEEYAARNEVLNKKSVSTFFKDPETVKLMNMLNSDMMKLKRDAAKIITRRLYTEPELYDVVNEALLKDYLNASDRLSIDAMAWLCKALGASGDSKYGETLQKVMGSSNPVLVRYAKSSYEMLP